MKERRHSGQKQRRTAVRNAGRKEKTLTTGSKLDILCGLVIGRSEAGVSGTMYREGGKKKENRLVRSLSSFSSVVVDARLY